MKRSHSKLLLVVASLVFALSLAIFTPVEALAKVSYEDSSSSQQTSDKRYFKDVKTKTTYRAEIEWLANRGAFKKIAGKGKKFYPSKTITRRQVGMIMDNLYGDRIDITIKSPNAKATQKFMTALMTEVSTQLGSKVTWSGGSPKATVSRSKACYYIRQMVKTGGEKLNP